MKKIKIFAVPSHGNEERVQAVDFARIIQPMKFLNGYSDKEVEFEVKIFDIDAVKLTAKISKEEQSKLGFDWETVAKNYDIVYFNYMANPWQFAAMGAMVRKYNKIIVLDVDDALWNVLPDNLSAYEAWKPGSDNIRNFNSICNEVDYITVTNRYLKNVVLNNTTKSADRVIIFPNYVDLDLYSHRSEFKDDGKIQLTHFGSGTHFISLEEKEFVSGIDRVMKEYPNVTFKTVGAHKSKFKMKWGKRYNHAFGSIDIYDWVKNFFPKYMDETDIMVVPLTDNIYNRAKSSIKFIESASAKKPGVWQNIRQYQEVIKDGENGFLAKTAKEWHESIKALIDDAYFRRKAGEAAFKTMEDNWQMKDHTIDYADFFKSILTR